MIPDYLTFADKRYIPEQAMPALPQLYRVLHECEIGGSRIGIPEVFPFLDNHFTPLTRSLQLLSKAINPQMTNTKWRALYSYQRAFTNRQGFGMDGDPRVDYVNRLDIGAPLPKQEALCCGGALLAPKYISDGWFYPDYIDGHEAAPTVEYVMARLWLRFTAVNIKTDGTPGLFPPGMENAQILLLAYQPIRIRLSHVVQVDMSEPLPGPYFHT